MSGFPAPKVNPRRRWTAQGWVLHVPTRLPPMILKRALDWALERLEDYGRWAPAFGLPPQKTHVVREALAVLRRYDVQQVQMSKAEILQEQMRQRSSAAKHGALSKPAPSLVTVASATALQE